MRVGLLAAACAMFACAKSNPVEPTATPSKAATIVIGAPTPVSPASGATSNGWPTFTVTNASRTGTTAPLMYRFEVSTLPSFASLVVTATVAETPNQTTFTPPAGTPPPPQGALFWRATAIDQVNNVTGTTSTAQNFTFSFPLSDAAQLSLQEGNVLWPGAQPTGTPGHAVLGNFWTVMMATSFSGVTFQSPTLEELQMFDLIDRGLDPQSAIEWLRANGYSTTAAYYPSIAVVGFPYEYMALVNGRWDLVLRVGA